MDADFSVELGADDPALEFPWSSEDGSLCHYDLRSHPEFLALVEEANRYPELREFLSALNGDNSIFETAKCDVWADSELSEAEEIYGGAVKLASYIDVLFANASATRFDFAGHERLARRAVGLIEAGPEIPATAELIIRRCYYGEAGEPGFYLTIYVTGYGDDDAAAQGRWGAAIKSVERALLQISRECAAAAL